MLLERLSGNITEGILACRKVDWKGFQRRFPGEYDCCFIYFTRAVFRCICGLSGTGGGGDAGFYPDTHKKDRLSSGSGIDGAGSRAGKADGKPAVFWLPDFYGRMRTDSGCQRSVFAYKRDGKENHNL